MRLPVQELKIDRSFISRMSSDAEISTIVRSTIDLGHNLGLKVVAEGVEDLSVWNLLRTLGCDDAQGFFMSRPLEPQALASWIEPAGIFQIRPPVPHARWRRKLVLNTKSGIGAKLRRCSGLGPNACRAATCDAVGYPLCPDNENPG